MYEPLLRIFARAASIPIQDYGRHGFRVTGRIISTLRDLPYHEQWQRSVDQRWYHVYLEDHSLFAFNTEGGAPSYVFLDRPIDVPSFRDFVTQKGRQFDRRSRDELRAEYEEVLATASLRPYVTPIRYDVDKNAYRSGTHPAAHIHIGLENEVRIAVRREMNPRAFFLFVVRQMYPECWASLLQRDVANRLPAMVRTSLQEVEGLYFGNDDKCQVYLE